MLVYKVKNMKSGTFLLFGLVLVSGALACGCSGESGTGDAIGFKSDDDSGTVLNVGESKGAGELSGSGAGPGTGIQNQTSEQERNEEHEQERDDSGNVSGGTHQEVQQETRNELDGDGSPGGISEQVRQIVEERQNGSITVPQGMLVRIVAQNHEVSVENATFQLQEQLSANVMVHGQNKSLKFGPDGEGVDINDGNVSVTTNETIEIENDSIYVAGQKVMLMPSSVPERIKAKTVKSMVLHLTEADLLYEVNATKAMKLFWLFDADMGVEATVDAETGQVKEQRGPWWAFLASEAG